MSTTQTTTNTNQYNPTSMAGYNSLQSPLLGALLGNINNPFSNSMFNTQMQMGTNALNARNQANMQRISQNAQALGGTSNALLMNQITQANRGAMGANAGMMNNLLLNAQQLRQQSLGQAQAYSPLQTGQTSARTQSGLGSWAPQLAAAGLSAFMGPMGLGASLLGGAAGGARPFGGLSPTSYANAAIGQQGFQTSYAPGTNIGYGDLTNPFLS